MGLLQPKGPNPHETDVNSPRYTEASKASKRATEMGISGDAATLLGRGFERVFIQSDMEFKTEAGDFAYIGNRVGMVTAVTKNATTQKVETITVVEDLGALPLDWRATPAEFGYDDNGPGSTTKTTTYAIDPSYASEVINGGGALLTTGTILICRKRTADKTTWTKEAQDAALFQAKFETPSIILPQSISINNGENIKMLLFSADGLNLAELVAIEPEQASQEVTFALEFVSGTSGTNTVVLDPETGILSVSESAVDDTTVFNVIVTSVANPSLSATIVLTLLEN